MGGQMLSILDMSAKSILGKMQFLNLGLYLKGTIYSILHLQFRTNFILASML